MATENKKTPHPYADVIKKWADGADVQWKQKHHKDWIDSGNAPSFSTAIDWRIKPVEPINEPINANYFNQFKVICKGIADGKEIQYRTKSNDKWFDLPIARDQDEFNFLFSHYEFRVKPKLETIRYQNYLLINNNVNCWASNDIETRSEIASNDLFVRWLGEEQAITIEVEDE